MANVPMLVGARLGALSGFVSEMPVVLADALGLQRVVGGAAAAISEVRPVPVCGMRSAMGL